MGYYYSDLEDQIRRSKTPEYFSRKFLSESSKPFVNIEELDSSTDAVISRKNYSYTSGPMVLYSGLSGYNTSYVSPSSLVASTTLSDYYPYYRLSSPLLSSSLLGYPYYGSGYYSSPMRSLSLRTRTHYPAYNDMSHYLARLLPYYYHPRPVYHTTYAPHYHYNYETPRTRVTRTTRTYNIPAIMPSYQTYAITSRSYYG
jgi:hypothetical protein